MTCSSPWASRSCWQPRAVRSGSTSTGRVRHVPPPRALLQPALWRGKAERFDLAEESRKRGIEPIELRQGDDLEQLVRDAVSRGADALAMAGGDGSKAVVAMVAAEFDVP